MKYRAMLGCGPAPTSAYIPQDGYQTDLGSLGPDGLNGWFDSLKTLGEKAGRGALDIYAETQRQQGAAEAYKAQLEAQAAAQARSGGGMPKWVIPVGIAALVAILMLRK